MFTCLLNKTFSDSLRKLKVFTFNTRSVIGIHGTDAEPFLQSMMTNDIKLLNKQNTALFGLFLNPKGRILFDAIVIKNTLYNICFNSSEADNIKASSQYFLDVNSRDKVDLIQHLQAHIIRKKVSVKDLSDTMRVLGSLEQSAKEGMIREHISRTGECISFTDPRIHLLGIRSICQRLTSKINLLPSSTIYEEEYHARRLLLGITEGSKENKNSLPLNLNFHNFNGISFKKGCYVGQQLTQRTYHSGTLRKRAMPFLFFSERKALEIKNIKKEMHSFLEFVNKSFNDQLTGKDIIGSNGVILGKVIVSKWNCGIAMIDQDKLKGQSIGFINGYETFLITSEHTI